MRKVMLTVFFLFLAIGIPGCGEDPDLLYPSDLSKISKISISSYGPEMDTISTTDPEIISNFLEAIPNEESELLTTEEFDAFVFTSCTTGKWVTATNSLTEQFVEKYTIRLEVEDENTEDEVYVLYASDTFVSKSSTDYEAISVLSALSSRIRDFTIASIKDKFANMDTVNMQVLCGLTENSIDITDEARIIANDITFEDFPDNHSISSERQIQLSEEESTIYYKDGGFYLDTPIGIKKIQLSQDIQSRINAKIATAVLSAAINEVDTTSPCFILENRVFDEYAIHNKIALKEFLGSATFLNSTDNNSDSEFTIELSFLNVKVSSDKITIDHNSVSYNYTVLNTQVDALCNLLITDVFSHLPNAVRYTFKHNYREINVAPNLLDRVRGLLVYHNIEIVTDSFESSHAIECHNASSGFISNTLYYIDGYVAIRLSDTQFARMPLSVECNELFAEIFGVNEQ